MGTWGKASLAMDGKRQDRKVDGKCQHLHNPLAAR